MLAALLPHKVILCVTYKICCKLFSHSGFKFLDNFVGEARKVTPRDKPVLV